MEPVFFASPAEFCAWLEALHGGGDERWVGYCERGAGTASLMWPESVDEALGFGGIDGVRRRVDAECYASRFMPRREGSSWCRVNLLRVEALVFVTHDPGIGAEEGELRWRSDLGSGALRVD